MSWPGFWLKPNWRAQLLRPLAGLVALVAKRRFKAFKQQATHDHDNKMPFVLVVGNLVVGGSGKTPLISWLIPLLQAQGWRVGVIARGYGGAAIHSPQQVTAVSDPAVVGDEPLMLAQAFDIPIVVCRDRAAALAGLLAIEPVDIVISDDGLQHYGLARDMELVVFDASRPNDGIGNGYCLPAGPLREPLDRLQQVDFVLFNGANPPVSPTSFYNPPSWLAAVDNSPPTYGFSLQLQQAYRLNDASQQKPLADFQGQFMYAIAGIGHPQRFFSALKQQGLDIFEKPFADHYAFSEADFAELDPTKPLVMTAKDAVKCQKFVKGAFAKDRFANANWWVCPVTVVMDAAFESALLTKLQQHPCLSGNTRNTAHEF